MCKRVTENNFIHIRSKELGTLLNGHQDSISSRLRNRDIFVKPPKEAATKGKVWHLEKCVYRLIDASIGNLPDGGTQGGYIIFLANEKGKVIPIWNSKKIRRVVRSTLAVKPWQWLKESMWQSSCQHCSQN